MQEVKNLGKINWQEQSVSDSKSLVQVKNNDAFRLSDLHERVLVAGANTIFKVKLEGRELVKPDPRSVQTLKVDEDEAIFRVMPLGDWDSTLGPQTIAFRNNNGEVRTKFIVGLLAQTEGHVRVYSGGSPAKPATVDAQSIKVT
ncbi:hypothetical protein ACFL6C_07915 [Myxococcota bacterium]